MSFNWKLITFDLIWFLCLCIPLFYYYYELNKEENFKTNSLKTFIWNCVIEIAQYRHEEILLKMFENEALNLLSSMLYKIF